MVVVVFGWLNGSRGRTPGEALVGLKLVRDRDRGTISGPRGLVRALTLPLMAIVSGGLIWVVALLWPRWDVKKQALHDKVVGVSVIESPASPGFVTR
jgi:uncharacterized RDD family membrane protein YckC